MSLVPLPDKNDRLFLFIDETGDPGYPQQGSSEGYQLNILAVYRSALPYISKHISAFKYFRDNGRELKEFSKDAEKRLRDILLHIANHEQVGCYVFTLEKSKYTGPYLKKVGHTKYDYDPKKFRNYVIRISLETFFRSVVIGNQTEVEIVFDRFLSSVADEENLNKYLHGNYNLPSFLHIIQVDSQCSDFIQLADLMGRFWGDADDAMEQKMVEHGFKIYCIENPDRINEVVKEKGPDTSTGTRPLPSISTA